MKAYHLEDCTPEEQAQYERDWAEYRDGVAGIAANVSWQKPLDEFRDQHIFRRAWLVQQERIRALIEPPVCASCGEPACGTADWGIHGRMPSCGEHGERFEVTSWPR